MTKWKMVLRDRFQSTPTKMQNKSYRPSLKKNRQLLATSWLYMILPKVNYVYTWRCQTWTVFKMEVFGKCICLLSDPTKISPRIHKRRWHIPCKFPLELQRIKKLSPKIVSQINVKCSVIFQTILYCSNRVRNRVLLRHSLELFPPVCCCRPIWNTADIFEQSSHRGNMCRQRRHGCIADEGHLQESSDQLRQCRW